MSPGDSVEVLKVWAFGQPPRWFGGYSLYSREPNPITGQPNIIVFRPDGAQIRYPEGHVRPAQK